MKKSEIFVNSKRIYVLAFVALTIASIHLLRLNDSQGSIKTAILKSDIPPNTDYIVAKSTWVTGFDWELVEEDKKLKEYNGVYFNILGPNPNDLKLKYIFDIAGNNYVFYVKQRKEFFNDAMNEKSLEYTVTGWDILYPVKHGHIFELFRSKGCITINDINKKQ